MESYLAFYATRSRKLNGQNVGLQQILYIF